MAMYPTNHGVVFTTRREAVRCAKRIGHRYVVWSDRLDGYQTSPERFSLHVVWDATDLANPLLMRP